MGRKKKDSLATGASKGGRAAPREVPVIQALGVYHRLDACRALGLGVASIAEEVRSGRLAVAVAPDGRWLILGEWLVAWLRERATHAMEALQEVPARGEGERPDAA